MESTFFSVSLPVDADGSSITMDGLSSPNAVFQLDQLNLENQKQKLAEYSGLTTYPREQFDDLRTDFCVTSRGIATYSDALVPSLERIAMRDALSSGSNCAANNEFQEQLFAGAPISGDVLTSLLAARTDLQEDLNNMAISVPSDRLPDASQAHLLDDYYNVPNSSFGFTSSHGYDEAFGNVYSKGDPDTLSAPVNPSSVTQMAAAFQSYLPVGNAEANSWISSLDTNPSVANHCHSRRFSNELFLSLATSYPTMINSSSIPDQCSEIECPGVVQPSWKETTLSSEQTCCKSKELSLRSGSSGHGQMSQTVVGSGYVQVVQEILSQLASYSLENLDQMRFTTVGMKSGANDQFSSSYPTDGGTVLLGSDESPDGGPRYEIEMDPELQKRALEVKKKQLLTLLEVVDDRYNQCLDEIHTVISAFHAATELDPQIHTRFALQTITFLYRSLRERISNKILAMSAHFDSPFTRETGESSETSSFPKQWTLQQLKKKDHQLWRPQRGLPERSVSVLRAWMFQNFLHPYPKDSEKHLLAIKSGLTRSQVSNWFINARVRLWKPLIEEMYAEMNRRKALQKEERSNSSQRSHITIGNRRFNINQS